LRRNKVNHLLCEKVDRLTRNFKEAVEVNDWAGEDDLRCIHFAKQNLIIHKNAKSDEKFRWDIEIVLAKKYISNLSEEVKKGQVEKLAQGWLPTKPPLGYKTIGEKGHKIHVIDGEIALFIRKMFEWYATGQLLYCPPGERII
ncbi:MAG: recombinase family protein, partial [Nanoarchaeota archaeon]